jgi:hypothetical protein
MKKISLSMIAGVTLLWGQALIAEDIKIPVGQQTPELEQIARPQLGASKASVKAKFGEPVKEKAAVGNPPISNWEYTDFIVYFENDHVIHSVLKPKYHESKETVIEHEDVMSEDDLKLKPSDKEE